MRYSRLGFRSVLAFLRVVNNLRLTEVDGMLWCALELRAELWVLGGDTDWAGIQVALSVKIISTEFGRS